VRQRVTEIRFGDSSVGAIVLGMSLILGFGGYAVMRGALPLGGLVAFYGYVVRLFEPVSIAIDLQSRLQRVPRRPAGLASRGRQRARREAGLSRANLVGVARPRSRLAPARNHAE